jgi:cytochrome c553
VSLQRDKLAAAMVAASFFLATGSADAQPKQKQKPTIAERFVLCTTCHGDGGVSTQPLIPSLAGQPSFYAITQLFLFREGRRNSEAMTVVAKNMTDDDLRAFSDFIGTLPPPPAPAAGTADPLRMARGDALAQRHRCASCHGADFAGGKQVARLAHQREDYLNQTLQEFRAAKRIGYTQAMNEALAGITPEALQDLAHYLAHVPPAAP